MSDPRASTSPDPARFVPAVLAGDAAAIDGWYREELPEVHRLCYGFLARTEDAEDAAQDAMLHLFDHLGHWDARRGYRSWRTTVVLNLCRDRLRRGSVRSLRESGPPLRERAARSVPDPGSLAGAVELRELLHEALGALSPREREVFVLRELEERSSAEVAQILDVSAATVRSLASLARRRLRRLLGPRVAPEQWLEAEGPA